VGGESLILKDMNIVLINERLRESRSWKMTWIFELWNKEKTTHQKKEKRRNKNKKKRDLDGNSGV
jgi:hypothetical protein